MTKTHTYSDEMFVTHPLREDFFLNIYLYKQYKLQIIQRKEENIYISYQFYSKIKISLLFSLPTFSLLNYWMASDATKQVKAAMCVKLTLQGSSDPSPSLNHLSHFESTKKVFVHRVGLCQGIGKK